MLVTDEAEGGTKRKDGNQSNKQGDRHTVRQTDKHTDRQTDI